MARFFLNEYEGTILPSRLPTSFQSLGYSYYDLISCFITSAVKERFVKYTKNSYFPSFRALCQLSVNELLRIPEYIDAEIYKLHT